ncbi:unnamed protein product [Alternaria burnsii]|nr:unnamed protein product [Alternaria burnsii]
MIPYLHIHPIPPEQRRREFVGSSSAIYELPAPWQVCSRVASQSGGIHAGWLCKDPVLVLLRRPSGDAFDGRDRLW